MLIKLSNRRMQRTTQLKRAPFVVTEGIDSSGCSGGDSDCLAMGPVVPSIQAYPANLFGYVHSLAVPVPAGQSSLLLEVLRYPATVPKFPFSEVPVHCKLPSYPLKGQSMVHMN